MTKTKKEIRQKAMSFLTKEQLQSIIEVINTHMILVIRIRHFNKINGHVYGVPFDVSDIVKASSDLNRNFNLIDAGIPWRFNSDD